LAQSCDRAVGQFAEAFNEAYEASLVDAGDADEVDELGYYCAFFDFFTFGVVMGLIAD